jgi:hippurate hydrolase
VVALFQPAEETSDGAQAMVDDGLASLLPTVDVAFAQHVLPTPAGHVGTRGGPLLSAADVIPDRAVLQCNIRTYSDKTRTTVLGAIRRIVTAECQASDSPKPPDFELFDRFPLTDNDVDTTTRVADAFARFFGDRWRTMPQGSASEDFSEIPAALGVPYTYWGIGGIDPATYQDAADRGRIDQDIPVNHSPTFAPVIQPTLDTGTQALVIAALEWLAPRGADV